MKGQVNGWKRLGLMGLAASISPPLAVFAHNAASVMVQVVCASWSAVFGLVFLISGISLLNAAADGEIDWPELLPGCRQCARSHQRVLDAQKEAKELRDALVTLRLEGEP